MMQWRVSSSPLKSEDELDILATLWKLRGEAGEQIESCVRVGGLWGKVEYSRELTNQVHTSYIAIYNAVRVHWDTNFSAGDQRVWRQRAACCWRPHRTDWRCPCPEASQSDRGTACLQNVKTRQCHQNNHHLCWQTLSFQMAYMFTVVWTSIP